MRGSQGWRPAPATGRPELAHLPLSPPLPRTPTCKQARWRPGGVPSFASTGSLPWTQSPGIRPPSEKLRSPAPAPPLLIAPSTLFVHPKARTAPVPRKAEASQIYLSRVSSLSVPIPCQNNKQVTANLQSAVLFRKTVYTPLTRWPLLRRPLPVTVKSRGGLWRRTGLAWSGRPGGQLPRASFFLPTSIGPESPALAAANTRETAICL